MTNEELVALIQSGRPEYAAELWQQVERLVAWKAHKVAAALPSQASADKEDLINTGYIAMIEAAETFDCCAGIKFSSWLTYYLKTHFAEATGYRTQQGRNDPCRMAISLDSFVGDGENCTIGDLIQDPTASATMDCIDQSLWVKQLHDVELAVLYTINQDQAEAVYRNFILGQTCEECAASMKISHVRAKGLIQEGMRNLRRPTNLCRLRPFLYFDYFHGAGLSAFRHSGMSIQERYLINLEEAEKRAIRHGVNVISKSKSQKNTRHEASVALTKEDTMEPEKKIALNEYLEAKKDLTSWASRVAELEKKCSGHGSLSDGAGSFNDTVAMELETALKEQTAAKINATAAMGRVLDLVQQLPTAEQRRVFWLRYIDGLSWASIAEREKKSRTWATNLHSTAVKCITLPAG